MYRKDNPHQMEFQNFYLPFGGELSGENRWVILAEQIPWQRIDQQYGELFSADEGCPAKAARVGFGALIIKERLGTTDRETVEQIRENPYLQYFLGFAEYSNKTPFHHSVLSYFFFCEIKRFMAAGLLECILLIYLTFVVISESIFYSICTLKPC